MNSFSDASKKWDADDLSVNSSISESDSTQELSSMLPSRETETNKRKKAFRIKTVQENKRTCNRKLNHFFGKYCGVEPSE